MRIAFLTSKTAKYFYFRAKIRTMRYFLICIGLLLLAPFQSCQKCFTCQNVCKTCTLKDSADVIIASATFCSDTANYYKADSLRARGYICDTSASSFTKDFCNNNAGGDNYTNYYNEKQFRCKNK
jgi:hypothetical protein